VLANCVHATHVTCNLRVGAHSHTSRNVRSNETSALIARALRNAVADT
jgi:hypothetical protein